MTPRVAPEAISIQAAAQILTVSQDTIRRRIKRGDLEAVRIGKLWRIPKSAIADLRRRREDGVPLFVARGPNEVVRPRADFDADVARLVALLVLDEAVRTEVRQRLEAAVGDVGDPMQASARLRNRSRI